ncbi:MAG: HPF/RaiA family ribosome-associated protein [Planctomycetota bacterium]|nr:HPF/RaiA family ribosome-associated protein [Planctomycetaceae bacterium]MDQ3329817.1 HPF/RaiA family ribosome-associated protein [Planctomycetota bacterium]
MQIQINTDNHIEGREALAQRGTGIIEGTLGRFGDRLTRVEVHLSDENSHKSRGDDKRCVMEARPAGSQPVAVTHIADTLDHALEGAAEKLERLLDSRFGRLDEHKGRTSFAGEQDL